MKQSAGPSGSQSMKGTRSTRCSGTIKSWKSKRRRPSGLTFIGTKADWGESGGGRGGPARRDPILICDDWWSSAHDHVAVLLPCEGCPCDTTFLECVASSLAYGEKMFRLQAPGVSARDRERSAHVSRLVIRDELSGITD